MPVSKKNIKYDVIVKTLRGRQVSCLVPVTPSPKKQKLIGETSRKNKAKVENLKDEISTKFSQTSAELDVEGSTQENGCISEQESCLIPASPTIKKKKLASGNSRNNEVNHQSPENKTQVLKARQSLVELDVERSTLENVGKQESVLKPDTSPLKKEEVNEFQIEDKVKDDMPENKTEMNVSQLVTELGSEKCTTEIGFISEQELPTSLIHVEECQTSLTGEVTVQITPTTPTKTYRRRSVNIMGIARRWSNSNPDLHDDNALFSASTYNLDSVHAPPNTPIIIKCDTLGDADSFPLFKKRGRGRPPGRKSRPPPVFVSDEESTCSVMSQDSRASSSNRRSRKLWLQELEETCEQEEPISEYEMMRQRNIAENSKILRELFMKEGFEYKAKSSSSDTPKVKKPYNRLPLPAPRPKSARIEERQPLDFSSLTQRLSMQN